VQGLQRRALRAIKQQFSQRHRATQDLLRRLGALSPSATLARGYAIVATDSGHVLHTSTEATPGERLRIQLHHGALAATVDAVEPET
jgi:exodeoxyribonuclease VII large subunit